MKRFAAMIWSRLDGLALAGLAGFMIWFPLAGQYWMLLNPKFKFVTLSAGGVLCILGGYALFRPVSRPRTGRLLAYAALASMIGLTQAGTQRLSSVIDSDPFAACPAPPPSPQASAPDLLAPEGVPYIPINCGELYGIAENTPGPAFGKPYVMRGYAHRDPGLEREHAFVLFRMAIWCCIADATAVGFKVTLPPDQPLPANGSWQVVFGHLAPVPKAARKPYVLPGAPFSSVSASTTFAAEHMETAIPSPEETSMFQWRTTPPYAY